MSVMCSSLYDINPHCCGTRLKDPIGRPFDVRRSVVPLLEEDRTPPEELADTVKRQLSVRASVTAWDDISKGGIEVTGWVLGGACSGAGLWWKIFMLRAFLNFSMRLCRRRGSIFDRSWRRLMEIVLAEWY